jgi:hypothetical protein
MYGRVFTPLGETRGLAGAGDRLYFEKAVRGFWVRKIAVVFSSIAVALLSACSTPCRHFDFKPVSPGIYAGCRPRAEADYAALNKLGVRTILSFETFPWHTRPERRQAERHHIDFRLVPIFASPLGPSERRMKEAILAIDDSSLRPVYIHCLYGRDRTAIVIALYHVYFDGWSPEKAWQDALTWGLKCDWTLWGFKTYFWHHTERPEWVRAHTAPGLAEVRRKAPP